MLLSIVIQVRALNDGQIEGGTGRGIHGYWFSRWKIVDPRAGDLLHERNDIPPFTLSPLMGLSRPQQGKVTVTKGDQAWFRITNLSNNLSQNTLQKWLPGVGDVIPIANLDWYIEKIITAREKHSWADQLLYNDLASAHLYVINPPKKWRFEFLTPVTFHSSKYHLPLPLPDSLVGSWLKRWQAYSPIALPTNLRERAREELVISAYNLKTIPIRHGKALHIGCVGWLILKAMNLNPTERAALDTLATFAFFAGSGHRTTQGMGLTRLIKI